MRRRRGQLSEEARSLAAGTPATGLAKVTVSALALLVAGLGVISALPRAGRGPGQPPVPRKAVELTRYLGLWHEFARYENRFERNTEAVTAEYSLRPDGLIRVVNAGRRGGALGRLRWVEGRARVVPGTANTKLKVAFFGPFFWGDYWILDHAEDYSWSIVGEGSRRYLWILTREAAPASALRSQLLGRVQALGYDPDRLHLTQHSAP